MACQPQTEASSTMPVLVDRGKQAGGLRPHYIYLREMCMLRVCTLVLTIVHPVLGGVVIVSKTSTFRGIWFIRKVLILFVDESLRALFWLLAISQRLEHGKVIAVLLWFYILRGSGMLALYKAEETNTLMLTMDTSHISTILASSQYRWGLFYWKGCNLNLLSRRK